MGYRPLTDLWLLTRCKYKTGIKRYGGYLGGFPERARALIGAPLNSPMLHLCGGLAKLYPYRGGFGPNDETQDLDPSVEPDHLLDASVMIPRKPKRDCGIYEWAGILIDPPYSETDSEQYFPGRDKYPNPHKLIAMAIEILPVGHKVGLIHYVIPRCPKNAKFTALVGVGCGFGNRLRAFTVFEKLAEPLAQRAIDRVEPAFQL
jgi:hypothetical protein